MYEEVIDFCKLNDITLVAVSKTRSPETILNMYHKGQRIFGENRVPELVEKHEALPKDIQWHMIGHLQSNKVKYISSFVTMIHSGASLSLLKEINKRASKNDRVIDVLLQIKIGKEETKSGWNFQDLMERLSNSEIQNFANVRIRGVMGMATFTTDETTVRNEFSDLRSYFEEIRDSYYSNSPSFDIVSMGMSGDYKIAAEEGSTMFRIGSLLFQ